MLVPRLTRLVLCVKRSDSKWYWWANRSDRPETRTLSHPHEKAYNSLLKFSFEVDNRQDGTSQCHRETGRKAQRCVPLPAPIRLH